MSDPIGFDAGERAGKESLRRKELGIPATPTDQLMAVITITMVVVVIGMGGFMVFSLIMKWAL